MKVNEMTRFETQDGEILGKPKPQNSNALPERMPTFEEFLSEEVMIDDINIKDIVGGIYNILQGSTFTREEIIDGLKNEFEIVATDKQIDLIIDGVKAKGLEITEAEEVSNKADWMPIKSYPYWDGIIKNTPNPKDRKLLNSIIDFAKKNKDLVSPRQWDILQRGKDGRLKPEDYHSKN